MVLEDAGALWLSKVHYWSTVVHHYELITTVAASPAAAAPRWVFRANFPKAIYQSVQSYSPQPSSYIFSSPGLGRGAEMPGDWRGCQQINWCLAWPCYTGLWWHNVTDNVDIFILFKHPPLITSKLRITSTCLTYLDTSDMLWILWSLVRTL